MLKQLVEAILPGTSRLEEQLVAAEGDLKQKRSTLDALLIDGQIEGPSVAKAADAVDAAERRMKHLRRALNAAQEKQAAEQAGAARQAQRDHANRILHAVDARQAAVEKLAASSKQFADDYRNALQANEALAALLPHDRDTIADCTDRPTFETLVRRNLAKQGLAWTFPCPFGTVDIPELIPQFTLISEFVRKAFNDR